MILKPFSANLSDTLSATDTYIPLSSADQAALIALLADDGEQIYLTITDDVYKEHVLVTLTDGTPVATRGVDSDAYKFPKGSCVFFEPSIPVIKWLICNYQCCDDECTVEAVAFAGAVLPDAVVGDAWAGTFVFSGDNPIAFGVTGMPSWMSAEYSGNYVKLSGTPTAAGSFTISVAASNDKGSNIAVGQETLTVTTE